MLPPFPMVAEPNLFYAYVGPQVIDVPVRLGRGVQVVIHPCTDASGAERTPGINVEPGLEAHVPKSPDADFGIRS